MSRTIPIYLQSEGEEYGMNQDIYVALMGYKKSKPSLFQSMMTTGNFTLEGSSSYSSRKVVICVPSLESTLNSFIPLSFMEVKKSEEPESILGIKRKPGERGPGRKDFTFDRTPSAVSRALTANFFLFYPLAYCIRQCESKHQPKLILFTSFCFIPSTLN